ncbi:protein adenylyltransferase/uridylyltransferase, putative [Syntrophotalea carbinolica DSM 2380]|uniref:Protein adenylyltransferase/uridylyltransferase, putative n=1 Tax=Syntrophotalea carbinolica (strain DSM 2380 / NBRC 103641 / GraBd1) TaxID=338963 RepID=Q3A4U6_SYNC1|nr:adenylyltransferase/uridylyltransferase [Syntrophotalea carbinolica]ABA88611.1 protein adenylyltransferase/uridylyltransferase, putative [Syntrophotalea carbinolica DSM 2380]
MTAATSHQSDILKQFGHLLDQVQSPEHLVFYKERLATDLWRVVLATTDKEGLLSVIAGLLTAHGANIRSADIITVSGASGKQTQHAATVMKSRIMDVLTLKLPDPQAAEQQLTHLHKDLVLLNNKMAEGGIEAVRDGLIDQVAGAIESRAPSGEQLLPVEIAIDNSLSESDTVIDIRSQDIPGFLFAFANALALLEINIEQATIRTLGDEVHDTFWIRDLYHRKVVDKDKLQELRFACALIKQFAYLLPHCPNPGQAIRQFRDLASRLLENPDRAADFTSIQSAETMQTLASLMGVSRFLWEDFLRMQHENLFPLIRNRAEIEKTLDRQQWADMLREELQTGGTHEDKVKILNDFKDREMFRIDLRHITRVIGDVTFARELTALTDVVVSQTALLCHEAVTARFGHPRVSEKPCGWGILAAGKYGGSEMGFASDLELLFIYEGQGKTQGKRPTDNGQYFEEFVRTFLKALKSRKEGIFEIDMRLRPFGNKGTLASSLATFRNYYAVHGQAEQFERLAMVKLRPVAGDQSLLTKVMQARDAFVYSGQPLDYANILHLRKRQDTELVASGRINLKLSAGGLVDIEYFLQAQLIEHGADKPELRVPNAMQGLKRLEAAGIIAPEQANDMRRAYRCFRRTIDALRAVRGNAKDLTLPLPDSPDYLYLSRRLGFENPEQLAAEIVWSRDLSRNLWLGKD